MPKPNRYHPYARPSSLAQAHSLSAQPLDSPRYPSPPTTHYRAQSLPSIIEQTPVPLPIETYTLGSDLPPAQPIESYQSIHPNYIRAETSDGAPLIARSIFRSDDGTLFVQMEIVGLPSTVTPPSRENPGLSGMTHYPVQKAQFQLQYEKPAYDIFVGGLGLRDGSASEPKHLGTGVDVGKAGWYPSPQTSSDGGYERGGRDEQTLVTGDTVDEDAEGEVDLEYKKFVEQERALEDLRYRAKGRGGR
jgi:hypothetical protein